MLSLPYGMLLFLYGIISLQTIVIAETCEDTHRGCEYLSKRGLCKKRESIMKRTCPKSCDMCQDKFIEERDIDNFVEDIENDSTCRDTRNDCHILNQLFNWCTERRRLMTNYCPKTCRICKNNKLNKNIRNKNKTTTTRLINKSSEKRTNRIKKPIKIKYRIKIKENLNCKDKRKDCVFLNQRFKWCAKRPKIMKKVCARTCNMCKVKRTHLLHKNLLKVPTKCIDKRRYCERLQLKFNYCAKYSAVANKDCCSTCNKYHKQSPTMSTIQQKGDCKDRRNDCTRLKNAKWCSLRPKTMKSICSYTCGYCRLSREYDKPFSIKKDTKFINKNTRTTILKKPKVREKFKTSLKNSNKKTIDLLVSSSSKSLQTTKATKTLKQMNVTSPTNTILNSKMISPTRSRYSIPYQTATKKEKNTYSDIKNINKPVNHSNHTILNNRRKHKILISYTISSFSNTVEPSAKVKIPERKTISSTLLVNTKSLVNSKTSVDHILPILKLDNKETIMSLSKTVKPSATVKIQESKNVASILHVNTKPLENIKTSIGQSAHILRIVKLADIETVTSLSNIVKPSAVLKTTETTASILLVNTKTLENSKTSINQSDHISTNMKFANIKRVTNSTSLTLKVISKNKANIREISYEKQVKVATIQADKKSLDICTDEKKICNHFKKVGWCLKRKKEMFKLCRKTCNLCNGVSKSKYIPEKTTTITTTTTTTTTKTPVTKVITTVLTTTKTKQKGHIKSLDSCQDKMKGCEMMKSRKMCSHDIMAVKCRKTCNYCGPNCQDKQKACPKMRKLNYCTKKKPLMEKLCQSTCGLCMAEAPAPAAIMSNIVVAKPKGSKCKNKYPDARCKYYSHLGWCDRNSEIRDNCQESCVCSYKTPVKPFVTGPCKESTFGCCWDNKSTKHNENGDNCPECKDDPRFGVLCGRFGSDCDGNGQLAVSLNKYCHSTCGKCCK